MMLNGYQYIFEQRMSGLSWKDRTSETCCVTVSFVIGRVLIIYFVALKKNFLKTTVQWLLVKLFELFLHVINYFDSFENNITEFRLINIYFGKYFFKDTTVQWLLVKLFELFLHVINVFDSFENSITEFRLINIYFGKCFFKDTTVQWLLMKLFWVISACYQFFGFIWEQYYKIQFGLINIYLGRYSGVVAHEIMHVSSAFYPNIGCLAYANNMTEYNYEVKSGLFHVRS